MSKQIPLSDEWLTPKQVADYLHVSLHTLEKWRRTGVAKGPAFAKLSPTLVRYHRDHVKQWVMDRLKQREEVSDSRSGLRGLESFPRKLQREVR